MKYKADKYTYRIEWSETDKTHVARCLEFPSIAAHGRTVEESLKEIEIAVTAAIQWMKECNEEIPEPMGMKKFKGHITLRVPPEVHRQLAIRSAEEGVSINQFVLAKL